MRRLLLLLLFVAPVLALGGVPNDKATPAYAEEQTILQLEQGLKEPGLAQRESGIAHTDRHTLIEPGRQGEYGVILQRGGNTWRTLRNGPLAVIAGVLVLLSVVVLAGFHLTKGPMEKPAGEPVPDVPMQRFTRTQRWVHWVAAIAFVVLAITGLIVTFGKKLLLPWMGHEVFAWIAIIGKWLHNIAGPVFIVASVVMFVVYLKHNHFQRADLKWLMTLGGLFGGGHPPAPYFNAGEKLWFWIGVTALGLVMAVSGLMLNFPYLGDVGTAVALTRYQLQWADVIHLLGAGVYIALGLGHIYLGTLGSPDAWQAMVHGDVSGKWAHAHHRIWYDEVKRGAVRDRAIEATVPARADRGDRVLKPGA